MPTYRSINEREKEKERKVKKEKKFDISSYISFSYDKENIADTEKEEKQTQEAKKNYSLITFLTSKQRPDIYLSDGSFLSGKDYVSKKRKRKESKEQKKIKEAKEEEEEEFEDINKDNEKNVIKAKESSSSEESSDNEKYNEMKATNIRYFNFNKNITLKCFNCGEVGHMAKNCPSEQVTFCIRCNQNGHEDRECKYTKCFKCNQMGHVAYECPVRLREMILCQRCNNIGHNSEDCLIRPHKINKNYLKFNNLSCFFCGSKDHLICPFKKNPVILDYKAELVKDSPTENPNKEDGELEVKSVFRSISNEEIADVNFCPLCGGKHKLDNCKHKSTKCFNAFDEKRAEFVVNVFFNQKKNH